MLSDSQPHSLTSAAEEIRAFPGDAEESDSVTCNAPKDLTGNNCPSSESAAVQATAKRLLFVGGTASWFHEIEHFLVELRPTWSGRHIADPVAAQDLLSSVPWDAMVVHEDVEGAHAFVADAVRKFPKVLGLSLREELWGGKARPTPTADSAPEAKEILFESAEIVVRTLTLHEWTSQPSINALLTRIKRLPTLPRLYAQVTQELQSPNGSLEVVSQFVRQDPVMSAKFLQVINSVFFGLAYTIADPGEAVMFP